MGFEYFPSRGASRNSVRGMANLWEFGSLYTPKGIAAALENAARQVAGRGGGEIFVPPGPWVVGVPDANEVATDEGTAVVLTEAHSNVSFEGADRQTVLVPISNRVMLFDQLGATNNSFSGFTFDNSGNGLLQGQVKPVTVTPGTGIAGMGNGANGVINSGKPGNLRIQNCLVKSFSCPFRYSGDWEDVDVLGETIEMIDVEFKDYAFGLLAFQYRHAKLRGLRGINGVDSIEFSGNTAAGHIFYGSNRTGAEPLILDIDGVYAYNSMSDPIKARKGKSVTWRGFTFEDCGRGFHAENLGKFAFSTMSVKLKDFGNGDSFKSGAHLTGLAGYEVDNIVVDRSGVTAAFGVQIEASSGGGFQAHDKRGRIRGVTVVDDLAGALIKPAIIVDGVTDIDIEKPIYRTTGNVATSEYAVDIRACTRVNVYYPARASAEASNPSASDRMVTVDSASTGCQVIIDRSCMDVDPTANSVVDLSGDASTRIVWMDEGAPVVFGTATTVTNYQNVYINNAAGADVTVTLPPPSAANKGRRLFFQNRRAFAVLSASANVTTLGFNAATATILPPGYGRWAILQSDGSSWVVLCAGDGDGSVATSATGPNGEGIGYSPGMGVGNAVAQGAGSGKATSVTSQKPTGQITMNGAQLNAGASVSFTLTCNDIGPDDTMIITHKSVGNLGDYRFAHRCGTGSATILVTNTTAGNLSEAIVLQYAVLKGAIT